MALIVPHQSNAGIAVANNGRAASYVSASAFMTPGQAAMPDALNTLARGMAKAGDAAHNLMLDRQRMRNATDLLADKVAYEDALRRFDSDYRQTRQGVSARNAEEDYDAFHQEQYKKLKEKWGDNPFLMRAVDRMVSGIREPSLNRAVIYRDEQEKRYQTSVLDASRAQTQRLFGDPSVPWNEKMKALEAEENNARLFAGQRREVIDGKEQWTGGLDVTADLMDLRQRLHGAHLDGLIGAERFAEADAFLLENGSGMGEKRAVYEARIKNGREVLAARAEATAERAKSARFSAMSASVWEETQGLPWEKRNEAAIERIAAITDDPKEQRALFAAFERDAAFQKIRENAATGKAARELAEDAFARDILPGDFLAELNRRDDITPEARTRAMELFRGEVKESPKNRTALRDLRADIDNGAARSSEDVEAFAFNHGLTPSQTKDALAYLEDNGKTGGLTQTRLDRLWKNAAGGRAPDDLFQWVRDQLPDGKKPTDKDLEDLMAKFAVKGTSPGKGRLFDGETLLEALRAHRGNEWLPDVSGAEFREISAVLRAKGLPHTMEAARRYKKNVIMGIGDRRETESER